MGPEGRIEGSGEGFIRGEIRYMGLYRGPGGRGLDKCDIGIQVGKVGGSDMVPGRAGGRLEIGVIQGASAYLSAYLAPYLAPYLSAYLAPI